MTREREALEERIRGEFKVDLRRLSIADWSIDFLTVSNPDELFDQMANEAEARGEPLPWEPYWAQAWDSAIAVAGALRRRDLRGQTVLDLGCGLGLSGAAAASRGARVVLADNAPPALLFARYNTWPWRHNVDVERVDWVRDRINRPPFSMIVGADVLYDVDQWPHLERFWRAHLAEEGELVVGEPGRSSSDGFRDWMSARGWQVDQQSADGARLFHARPDQAVRGAALSESVRDPGDRADSRRPSPRSPSQ